MIRAVLDANVLAGGFPAKRGPLFVLARYWEIRGFELVYSEHLLSELTGAWRKPYWNERLTDEFITQTLIAIRRFGILVEPTPGISGIATHWQDDLVIATAIAGDAQYLVTGDKELLEIAQYQSVEIIAPAEFLEILSTDTPEL